MRILLAFGLLALARAQEFEAASVKPSAPPVNGMMRFAFGGRGGPGTDDPTRISYVNTALKDLMTTAYDVKRMQIIGPDWLDSLRFDITATMAPGTTKEQFHVMLQKLLADRFGLTLHREKKEMAAFVLTMGKKGLKVKESAPEPAAKEGDPKPEDGMPPPPPLPGGRDRMKMGKDGFPELPAGRGGQPMMIIMPGRAKIKATATTMAEFAGQLERMLNKPVVDQTGLKGKYDFELTFAPDAAIFAGRGPMMAPGGPPPEMKADDVELAPLPVAVQEQLGLKLDSQKTQVDVLVIDRVEKVPTEN